MSKHHDFVTEFIEMYKISPCLWNKKDPHYHNSNVRETAYTLLLEKFREYDEKATKAMVKSKINSLRSTYVKELRKVKDSGKSGTGCSDVYKPSLWYFDLFSFINDQQAIRTCSISSMDTSCDNEDEAEAEDSQSITDKDGLDDECFLQGQSNPSSDHLQEITRPSSSSSSLTTGSKRSAVSVSKKTISNKNVLELVADRLKRADDVRAGKHDSFGKHVADELNNMCPEMVPYVKKIINLAIFEGHMKTLNTSSSIVTQQVCPYPSLSQNYWTPQPPHSNFSTSQPQQGLSTLQPPQGLSTLQPQHSNFSNLTSPSKQTNVVSAGHYLSQFSDK